MTMSREGKALWIAAAVSGLGSALLLARRGGDKSLPAASAALPAAIVKSVPPAPLGAHLLPPLSAGASALHTAVAARLTTLASEEGVALDAELNVLEAAGLGALPPAEVIEVIARLDFGDGTDSSQGRGLLLVSMLEGIRDRCTAEDVAGAAKRLDAAGTPAETAKWLAALDAMATANNAAAYAQLFRDLPDASDPGAHLMARAETVGRSLGRAGSADAVRLLLTGADSKSKLQRMAAEAGAGFVQDTQALFAAAEVIDGPAPRNTARMALVVRMLGHIPSEFSVVSLNNIQSDPDPVVADAASESLRLLIRNHPTLARLLKPIQ